MIQGAVLMSREAGGPPLCGDDFENFGGLYTAIRNQI